MMMTSKIVDDLKEIDLTVLASVYAKYDYLSSFSFFDEDKYKGYLREKLIGLLEGEKSFILKNQKKGKITPSIVAVEYLPWDSDFFSLPMGRIQYLIDPNDDTEIKEKLLSDAKKKAKSLGIELLTIKVNSFDKTSVHALEKAGFHLMDTHLIYTVDQKEYRKQAKKPFKNKLRAALLSDKKQVLEITRESFYNYFGRFHADPDIPDDLADALYECWVDVSFSNYADLITVAVDDKDIVIGYGTLNYCIEKDIKDYFGVTIGSNVLSSVSSRARGKGVYRDIIDFNSNRLFDKKVDFVQNLTQIENRYVQRALISLGFRPSFSGHSFHGKTNK